MVAIDECLDRRPSLSTPISGARRDSEHFVQHYYPGSLLALHAYSCVPPFPDSHGCIRLTQGSAARLWAVSYVGEPLYTYR